MSWLTTVDHKRIGFLYGISALFFFLVGGVEALFIRIQLAVPNNSFLSAQQYNEMFTMHATTMIFLASCRRAPRSSTSSCRCRSARATWPFPAQRLFVLGLPRRRDHPEHRLVPARRRARRRLVRLRPAHDAHLQPDATRSTCGSWACSCSASPRSPRRSTSSSTIINMRAPGMTMMRLPVFTWMTLVTSLPDHPLLPRDHDRAGRDHDGPALRDQLLRGLQRRAPDPLAAPFLDLRPSRGLHPDPAGDGHHLGDPARRSPGSRCSATRSSSSRARASASSASASGATTCSRPAWARWRPRPSR